MSRLLTYTSDDEWSIVLPEEVDPITRLTLFKSIFVFLEMDGAIQTVPLQCNIVVTLRKSR